MIIIVPADEHHHRAVPSQRIRSDTPFRIILCAAPELEQCEFHSPGATREQSQQCHTSSTRGKIEIASQNEFKGDLDRSV